MRPAVAESHISEGKSAENEAASQDAQVPMPLPSAPAEPAAPRPKRADTPAQMGVREEPARVTSEAFAPPGREGAGAAAAAPVTSSARQDERIASAVSVPEPERAFGRLEASRPRTTAEWRRLRDAWNTFATVHPDDPRADEARVRAIESGREAWLAGGADDDVAAFERDARSYLAREDARQKERVERLLALPPRRP